MLNRHEEYKLLVDWYYYKTIKNVVDNEIKNITVKDIENSWWAVVYPDKTIFIENHNGYQEVWNPLHNWNQLMSMCREIISHEYEVEGVTRRIITALGEAQQETIYLAVLGFVEWEMNLIKQQERRKNAKTFKELIMGLEADENLKLESYGKVLKWVRFGGREYYKGDGIKYSWSAEYSYKNSRCVGYIHPLRSNNYIQTFKTLDGAKRNFIKRFKNEYEKIICKLEKK